MIGPASSSFFLKTMNFWPQGSSQPPAHVARVEAIIFFPSSFCFLFSFPFSSAFVTRRGRIYSCIYRGSFSLEKLIWWSSFDLVQTSSVAAASPSSRGHCRKTPQPQPEQRLAPGSPAQHPPARTLQSLIFVVSAEILYSFRGGHNSCFLTSPGILFGLSAAVLWCWCQLLKQSVWTRFYLEELGIFTLNCLLT